MFSSGVAVCWFAASGCQKIPNRTHRQITRELLPGSGEVTGLLANKRYGFRICTVDPAGAVGKGVKTRVRTAA